MRLERHPTDTRTYYTPTYPIAPYGYTPFYNYGKTHFGNILENGVQLVSTDFKVDDETGTIVFDVSPVTMDSIEESTISMNYTWRAFVRVSSCTLTPSTTAPLMYTGEVEFEQVFFDEQIDYRWEELAHRCEHSMSNDVQYTATAPPSRNLLTVPNPGFSLLTAPSLQVGDVGDTGVVNSFLTVGVVENPQSKFLEYAHVQSNTTASIYEIPWVINRATEMAVFGCADEDRYDNGFRLNLLDMRAKVPSPNNGEFYTLESDYHIAYIPLDANLPDNAVITGIEMELEFDGSEFAVDWYKGGSNKNLIYSVEDVGVYLVKGGVVQKSPLKNRAQNVKIHEGYGNKLPPFHENFVRKTITYGGFNDTWDQNLTGVDLKTGFGVAVKVNYHCQKDFFLQGFATNFINRHSPKFWCVSHKIFWK